jgi:hypothetical protein
VIRPLADLTVERARILRATPESRAHLDAALLRVSPAAVGVPPGALLVVRRLAARARLGSGMRTDLFATHLQDVLRDRLARARDPAAAGPDDDLLVRDGAELAAAVIAAWLDGVPAKARAWQRIVTAGEIAPGWWRRAVLPDPRLLPCVIAALTRQGKAAAWIARLDPAEVLQATRGLAAAHGCEPTSVVADAPQPFAPRSARGARERAAVATVLAIVPEASIPTLTGPACALLTLALALDRRPAVVRTPGFARALAAIAVDPPSALARTFAEESIGVPAAAPARTRSAAPDKASPPIRPAPVRSLERAAQAAPGTTPVFRADAAIETRFGGIFFLLNALLAMGVYGDFTRPLAVPDAPSPFDLLALLGRHWFGARFRRDPIDARLADLAGRELGEPIRFAPSPWQVPEAWLNPWLSAANVDGWHPAGFPLGPAPGDRRLPCGPLARWTAALALYLQARLALALAVRPRAALRATCCQTATVLCESDRVTLTFALATHPIALRTAGLDRDPGYLPAARRDVRFVFA